MNLYEGYIKLIYKLNRNDIINIQINFISSQGDLNEIMGEYTYRWN